jgi:hypothetical protein
VLAAKPEFGRANVGWRHDLDFSQWPPGIHRIDLGLSLVLRSIKTNTY